MKLLIVSDLHLELGSPLALPPGLDYDAVVLAGDIHSPGHKAVHWAQRASTFGGKPVVFVPGNHEFYGRELRSELGEMFKAAHGSNVYLLDRRSVVVDGVRFLGCLLWTDFLLPISGQDGTKEANLSRALAEANQHMNDFRLIEMRSPVQKQYRERELRRLLRAEDTLAMHWVDRDWLRRELAKPFDGPTVVVTHHAPASGSVAPRYEADWLTPAFASELPCEFFERATLWIHGHTHSPFDYTLGGCRIVSNPRGYRARDGSFENHQFDAGFVVGIEERRKTARQGYLLDLAYEPTEEEFEKLAGDALTSARAHMADMVDIDRAAELAGVQPAQLQSWAALKHPRVIALEDHGLRFPRWQFAPPLWTVVGRLAQALEGDSWAMLNWLESPAGAFNGRTPRSALEQGESPERVLQVASFDGL